MRTKITEYKKEIGDWMERVIADFKNPDPHKQLKIKLDKQRQKRRERLQKHFGV